MHQNLIQQCKLGELKGREPLLKISKQDKFLFHGSAFKLSELEPRQPYNLNKETKKMAKDGMPAVIASPFFEVAIFRALINNRTCPKNHRSGFGYKKGKLVFSASQSTIEQAKQAIGYVHIVNKNDFIYYSDMEWRCYHKVKTLCIIKVSFKDLPLNITVGKTE